MYEKIDCRENGVHKEERDTDLVEPYIFNGGISER